MDSARRGDCTAIGPKDTHHAAGNTNGVASGGSFAGNGLHAVANVTDHVPTGVGLVGNGKGDKHIH